MEICHHCLKKIDTKYQTKKIKNTCGHVNLYHYHCYMNICKDIRDIHGNMCCFYCYKYKDIYHKISFKKNNRKSRICKRIKYLCNEFQTKSQHSSKFDKLIIIKKIFDIIENNIQYFQNNTMFYKVLKSKCQEVINEIKKNPNLNIGLNILEQAERLNCIKKI
jgi:hypothetical protein